MIFGVINYLKIKSTRRNLCEQLFPNNKNTNSIFDFSKLSKRKTVDIFTRIYLLTNIPIRVYEVITPCDGFSFKKVYDNIMQTKLLATGLELEIILNEDKNPLIIENSVFHVSKNFEILPFNWICSRNQANCIIDEDDLIRILQQQKIISKKSKLKLSEALTLYSKIKNLDDFSLDHKTEGLTKNIMFYHTPNYPSCKTSSEDTVQLANNSYELFDQWRKNDIPRGELIHIYLFFNRFQSKFKFLLTPQLPDGYEKILKMSGNGIPSSVRDDVSGYFTKTIEDPVDPGEVRRLDDCFCPKTYFTKTKSAQSLPLGRMIFYLKELIYYQDSV